MAIGARNTRACTIPLLFHNPYGSFRYSSLRSLHVRALFSTIFYSLSLSLFLRDACVAALSVRRSTALRRYGAASRLLIFARPRRFPSLRSPFITFLTEPVERSVRLLRLSFLSPDIRVSLSLSATYNALVFLPLKMPLLALFALLR